MKIKFIPEDFVVEERVNLPIQGRGEFSLYLVHKQNLTTDNAMKQLSRWMKRPLRDLSHAGMKDRHGLTTQYITVHGDGPQHIETEHFRARRIGYADEPVSSHHLSGNHFRIVLRDLSEEDIERIERNRPSLERYGIPNYYDDQRFRSQPSAKNAFAFHLMRSDYENGFRVYLMECLNNSNGTVEALIQNWGAWTDVKIDNSDLPNFRKALSYLRHNPNDYQGAIYKLDRVDLRMMIAAGYSYLWNELLARRIRQMVTTDSVSVKGAWQDYAFFRALDRDSQQYFNDLSFAIPPNSGFDQDPDFDTLVHSLFKEYRLNRENIDSPLVSRLFPGSIERQALMKPENLSIQNPSDDDLHPGRFKLELSFTLKPGSYATMVIKRLTL
ncbi:MAG: tRNA pseudouridine(13) synthase TruD [bacterium]